MKNKIDWTEVLGATIAVLACVTTVITATATLMREMNEVREAHNERIKLKDANNSQSTPNSN